MKNTKPTQEMVSLSSNQSGESLVMQAMSSDAQFLTK